MRGTTLAYVALCLFFASWFLPVHAALDGEVGGPFGANPAAGFQAGTPPGVRAVVMTWDMLVHEGDNWTNTVLGTTCFTNAVMLLAVIALLLRRQPRWLGSLLLFCAILNAGWLYLLIRDPGFIEGLRVGYFMWTISFGLAGVAFLRGTPTQRRKTTTDLPGA